MQNSLDRFWSDISLKNVFVISPHLLTNGWGWGGGQQFIRIQSHIYLGTPAVLIFLLTGSKPTYARKDESNPPPTPR